MKVNVCQDQVHHPEGICTYHALVLACQDMASKKELRAKDFACAAQQSVEEGSEYRRHGAKKPTELERSPGIGTDSLKVPKLVSPDCPSVRVFASILKGKTGRY